MQNKRYLGTFELGCIVFNLLTYRMFTSQSGLYPRSAGSAAWILSLLAGLIFLGILALLLHFYRPAKNTGLFNLPILQQHPSGQIVLHLFLFAGFTAIGISSLITFVHVMQKISYPTSPFWFLALFFLLASLVTCLCGAKAVFRLHSLSVAYIGIVLVVIALSALRYANPYHLTPIFGTGISMLKSLPAALFQYIDILLIFFLSPMKRKEVRFSRTVFWAAAAAVFLNVLLMLIFCLHVPYEVSGNIQIPLYPLTKAVYFGKFVSRLDAVYLTAFAISAILYLSTLLYFLQFHLQKIKDRLPKRKSIKSVSAMVLLLVCCFSLTACYDNREVEESAYLIALGIDQGEKEPYRFTFQISNPLMNGTTNILSDPSEEEEPQMETEKNEEPPAGKEDSEKAGKEEEEEEKKEQSGGSSSEKSGTSGAKESNKTVNNLTVEAADYFTAVEELQSSLSKKIDMSHIKLIVFSAETAKKGIMEHSDLLLQEREVRPATSLCVAKEDAQTFLTGINPSFEESTARYYELLFGNEGIPYSPTVELREFVNSAREQSADGVLPIADNGRILGMAYFHNGKMVGEVNGEDAMFYKLLTGTADHLDMNFNDTTVRITSESTPKIQMVNRQNQFEADISFDLKTDLMRGEISSAELNAQLKERCTAVLSSTLKNGCDLLGLGRRIKARCLTQEEWDSIVKPVLLSNVKINLSISLHGKI